VPDWLSLIGLALILVLAVWAITRGGGS
jgi:hypothetical protein